MQESDETIVDNSKTFLIHELLVIDDICDVFILAIVLSSLPIETTIRSKKNSIELQKELLVCVAGFQCLMTRVGTHAWGCFGINPKLVEVLACERKFTGQWF